MPKRNFVLGNKYSNVEYVSNICRPGNVEKVRGLQLIERRPPIFVAQWITEHVPMWLSPALRIFRIPVEPNAYRATMSEIRFSDLCGRKKPQPQPHNLKIALY